jgi:hypothetical protein
VKETKFRKVKVEIPYVDHARPSRRSAYCLVTGAGFLATGGEDGGLTCPACFESPAAPLPWLGMLDAGVARELPAAKSAERACISLNAQIHLHQFLFVRGDLVLLS